jgi:hypothetical protein
VKAPVEKEPRDLGMGGRRGRHDDGLRRGGDVGEAGKQRESELPRDFLGTPGVVIVNADDPDPRERSRDAGVVPAEVADADHGEADFTGLTHSLPLEIPRSLTTPRDDREREL